MAADIRVSMDGDAIEDDDVPTAQRRHQDLVDIRAKAGVVDRSIEDRRRRDAVGPERGDHRVRLPMPARRVIDGVACHADCDRIGAANRWSRRIHRGRCTAAHRAAAANLPAAALSDDVGSPLLFGVDGFF